MKKIELFGPFRPKGSISQNLHEINRAPPNFSNRHTPKKFAELLTSKPQFNIEILREVGKKS